MQSCKAILRRHRSIPQISTMKMEILCLRKGAPRTMSRTCREWANVKNCEFVSEEKAPNKARTDCLLEEFPFPVNCRVHHDLAGFLGKHTAVGISMNVTGQSQAHNCAQCCLLRSAERWYWRRHLGHTWRHSWRTVHDCLHRRDGFNGAYRWRAGPWFRNFLLRWGGYTDIWSSITGCPNSHPKASRNLLATSSAGWLCWGG